MSVHKAIHALGDNVKHIADWFSVAVAAGALSQILPPLASLLTIVWMSLRIYDWFEARLNGRRLPKDQ
jgi:hypothetical protein